jgi:hypothetical protein
MLYGAPAGAPPPEPSGAWPVVPVTVALGLLLLTGLVWPPGLDDVLGRIAKIVAR